MILMPKPNSLIPCDSCGAHHQLADLQRTEIHLKGEFICKDCVKRVLLIAGQVTLPGWINQVWQPRNLTHIAATKHNLLLSRDDVVELCDLGRESCLARLNDAYHEHWNDFTIEDWLKDREIIDVDNRENIA